MSRLPYTGFDIIPFAKPPVRDRQANTGDFFDCHGWNFFGATSEYGQGKKSSFLLRHDCQRSKPSISVLTANNAAWALVRVLGISWALVVCFLSASKVSFVVVRLFIICGWGPLWGGV